MEKELETGADHYEYIEKFFVKGLVRILILSALKEGAKCGYHIYQYVNSKIKLKTSLSTIYTIIKELAERGLIARIGDVYQLTERGLEVLRAFASKYSDIRSFL